MNKNNKVLSHKFFSIISGIFLVVSLIVFIAIGFYAQYQDIKDTYTLAHEITEFLQTQCEKFDKIS